MNDNISWLVACPAGDQNFKNHLAGASASEVKAAISKVEGQEKSKTKMKTLLAALKRKQAAQAGGAENGQA